MIITGHRHAVAAFRQMRLNRRLTQRQLGELLHVAQKSISYRETPRHRMDTEVLIHTAHAFGYDVALIPKRHPGARPTGTGWPA